MAPGSTSCGSGPGQGGGTHQDVYRRRPGQRAADDLRERDRNRSQGLVSAQWDAVAGPGELRLRATGCTKPPGAWKVSTTTTHSASSTPPNDYSRRSTRPPRPSRSASCASTCVGSPPTVRTPRRPANSTSRRWPPTICRRGADLSPHPRCRERQLQCRRVRRRPVHRRPGQGGRRVLDPVQFFERTYRRTACATSSTAMCGAWPAT